MAVDGKSASGRLAAATVLWLLVAIFANQDYVNCVGEEEEQQQLLQQQLLQQQQLQQQQLQQQQLQRQQLQQQKQKQKFGPPQQEQQQLPSTTDQQQQFVSIKQQQPLPPTEQQQFQTPPQLPPNIPPNLPPNMSQISPNLYDRPSMNSDFGTNNPPALRPNQQLNTFSGPLNMPDDNRIPGGPISVPVMEASGLPQMPTVNETNLGINPLFHSKSPSEFNPNSPSLQTNSPGGQIQYRPSAQSTEQEQTYNRREPLYNGQESMNNLQKKLPMPYSPNRNSYYPMRVPTMNQQRLQQQSYLNRHNYEAPPPNNRPDLLGNTINILGGLTSPMKTISDVIPENPLGKVTNTFNTLKKYGEGVKDGIHRVFRNVVGKAIDHGQSGVQEIMGLGSRGANALFDISRKFLISDSRNQQTDGGFDERFTLPQQNIQPTYDFNPNQRFPGQMPYNNMQYHVRPEHFMGGNNNGQRPPRGIAPQFNEY